MNLTVSALLPSRICSVLNHSEKYFSPRMLKLVTHGAKLMNASGIIKQRLVLSDCLSNWCQVNSALPRANKLPLQFVGLNCECLYLMKCHHGAP